MKIRIAELRKEKGLTQAELAAVVGISRPFLAQIETGERNLSLINQKKIAKALGCTPSDIVDFDADEQREELILTAYRAMSAEQRHLWDLTARALLDEKDG